MEDIIRRIISIEDKAQEIMLDVRKAESGLNERVAAEDKKLAERIRNEAAERCRKIRETEHNGISGRIDEINARTETQIAALEKKYNDNKEKGVDDMVRHIIGE